MPLNSGPWDWLFKAFRFLLYPADHLNRVCWSRDWGLILRALTGGMYNQSNHTLIGTCTSLTGNWNKRFYGRKTCHWTVADQGSVKDHVWYVKVGNSVCMQIMMCVHVCVCVLFAWRELCEGRCKVPRCNGAAKVRWQKCDLRVWCMTFHRFRYTETCAIGPTC